MVIAYGATFVGMTTKKILSDSMVLFGAFVYPLMYVLVSPLFQGYGGKLGMIALLTTTLLLGVVEIARYLEIGMKKKTPERMDWNEKNTYPIDPDYKLLTAIRMPRSLRTIAIVNALVNVSYRMAKVDGSIQTIPCQIPTRDGATLRGEWFVPATPRVDSPVFLYFPGGGF
ncbi:MAG: hypothetical protein MZU97_05395 [Bacillus subtilis]|nr:hypothetical protein [Bacillus subtilis]